MEGEWEWEWEWECEYRSEYNCVGMLSGDMRVNMYASERESESEVPERLCSICHMHVHHKPTLCHSCCTISR